MQAGDFKQTQIMSPSERQVPAVKLEKKSWTKGLKKFWDDHKRSLVIFFVIVGAALLATKQIQGDKKNTTRAENQGNVLTIPKAEFKN